MPTMKNLFAFFIPLGLAACLVTITHVIVHASLTNAHQPEVAIASYAIGMSLLMLFERPTVFIRNTSSALVRDKPSFRAVAGMTWIVITVIAVIGMLISYTPLGNVIFAVLFRADPVLVPEIVAGYRFFMWVSVFSAIRCLYHGVIISQMRTKWVTIGMIVRLIGMFTLSQWFVTQDAIYGGYVGAMIFATGMCIEMLVCYAEGRKLVKTLPDQSGHDGITTKRQAFQFYRPLMFSSAMVVFIFPATNALLGQTTNAELSIASFAVATSIFNLIMSFFTYIHQIVLNFYPKSPGLVRQFQQRIGFLPGVLLGLLCWSPAGSWLLQTGIGLDGPLLMATSNALIVFAGLAFILPWLDYGNGFLMLRRTTHVFVLSQGANAAAALIMLLTLIQLVPHWNGMIGPLALTMGFVAEFAVVSIVLYRQNSRNIIGTTVTPNHTNPD
jgi:hypothetical protein